MSCDLTDQCNSYFQIRKQTKGEMYSGDVSVHIYGILITTFADILIACFSTNFVCFCVFFLWNGKQVAKQCLLPF